MTTMGDLIETLTPEEKKIIKKLGEGVRGTKLTTWLEEEGISQETFKKLTDEKLSMGELTLLMDMADEWL